VDAPVNAQEAQRVRKRPGHATQGKPRATEGAHRSQDRLVEALSRDTAEERDRPNEDHAEQDVVVVALQQAEQLRPDDTSGDQPDKEQRGTEHERRQHPRRHRDRQRHHELDPEACVERLGEQPPESEAGGEHREGQPLDAHEAQDEPDHQRAEATHRDTSMPGTATAICPAVTLGTPSPAQHRGCTRVRYRRRTSFLPKAAETRAIVAKKDQRELTCRG